ncbi:MAG TPA: glycosyltransferase [Polyangiaceae bacterium]
MEPLLMGNAHIEHRIIAKQWRLGDAIAVAWGALRNADYLVLNNDHRPLFVACALYWLVAPRFSRRCKLVSVDLLLRPPFTLRSKVLALVRRALLLQVDLFVLYFKNVDGYVRQGVPRSRCRYVPFKVNSWEKLVARRGLADDGDYVLVAGATLRDHATFVEAIRRIGIPAVILIPGRDRAQTEQQAWYRAELPKVLRVEFHSDGAEDTYLGYFQRAKIVCLPRYRWDIASTGISAYLCAMALGKCVVVSKGPGAEDVLAQSEAAVFFEPEDPADLVRALKLVWEDAALRGRIAANGVLLTETLKGEENLLRNLLVTLGIRDVQVRTAPRG